MDLKSWNETMLDNRSVISTQKIYKNLARVPLGRDECKGSKCPSTKGSRLRQGFGGQARNYKVIKLLRFRLAETEHELVVRTPPVVGSRPTAAQPQTAAVVLQLEDARAAVRAGDLLHAHINPFMKRLILVLQTIIGTGIGRTQFQSENLGALVNLINCGIALESEIGYGKSDEGRPLRIFTRHEFPILEH